MSNVQSRLIALEQQHRIGANECSTCGWPLPADKQPPREWFVGKFPGPIDLNTSGEPVPDKVCDGCGRVWKTITLKLDGDKEISVGAEDE